MAIYLENFAARYLVGVYYECRKNGTYPAAGSWGDQTGYCVALFEFLDNIRAESDLKNAKAAASSDK